MYYSTTLDFPIQLEPSEFSKFLKKNILTKLDKKLLGQYLEGKGKVVEIKEIENILQLPLVSNGNAEFQVTVNVLLFNVKNGDKGEGTISWTNKLGCYIDEEHHQLYLPSHFIPKYSFNGDGFEGPGKIYEGSKINFTVLGNPRYNGDGNDKFNSIINLTLDT